MADVLDAEEGAGLVYIERSKTDQEGEGAYVVYYASALYTNDRIAGTHNRLTVHMKGHSAMNYGGSEFLVGLSARHKPHYVTSLGEAWVGDSRNLLREIEDCSIDLVVTSPPYGLVKKRNMGMKVKRTMYGGSVPLRGRSTVCLNPLEASFSMLPVHGRRGCQLVPYIPTA